MFWISEHINGARVQRGLMWTCCPVFSAIMAVVLVFSQDMGPANRAACTDVAAADFKNQTILIGKRVFAFNDGIALNYDVPGSSTPDWKAAWN
jgi:hypothetical protein